MKFTKQSDVYNIYTIYDNVSKRYRGIFYHSTDEDMVRTSLPTVLMDFPLRDITIYRIGTFSESLGVVKESRHVKVDTKCYTFPHSRLSSKGDDISLEEVADSMKQTKAELIAKMNVNSQEKKEVKNE